MVFKDTQCVLGASSSVNRIIFAEVDWGYIESVIVVFADRPTIFVEHDTASVVFRR
jgi:hypothetical protein